MLSDKISIVIPVYNTDQYLPKCIDSVLNQTHKNLEIILVDDGSTDKSAEICDIYLKKDNRIQVIHQKNSGSANALNNGIKIATGKFLGFVDSDDYIETDMYETLLDTLYIYDADIVECGYSIAYAGKIKTHYKSGAIIQLNTYQALEALFLKKLRDFCWNKLYKRDLVNIVEFPERNISEDIAWTYKIFSNSQKIVFIDLAKYYYVYRDGSISSSSCLKKLDWFYNHRERLEFIAKNFPSLFNLDQKNFFKHILGNYRKLQINQHVDKYKKNRNELRKYILANYDSFYLNPLMDKKNQLILQIFRTNDTIACFLLSFYKKLKGTNKFHD